MNLVTCVLLVAIVILMIYCSHLEEKIWQMNVKEEYRKYLEEEEKREKEKKEEEEEKFKWLIKEAVKEELKESRKKK